MTTMTEQRHTALWPNIPVAEPVRHTARKVTITCPTCGTEVKASSVVKANAEYGQHWTRAVDAEEKVAAGEWFTHDQAEARLLDLGYRFRGWGADEPNDWFRSEDDRGRLAWRPVAYGTDHPEHKRLGVAFFLRRPFNEGEITVLGPDHLARFASIDTPGMSVAEANATEAWK